MHKNNHKLEINTSKSNQKITAIKPVIKLETNPEILNNLKKVFSSQTIQEQIKNAVNKLQADDALPSPKRMNVITPGHIKYKPRLQPNVKETLRTSILHKSSKTKADNSNKNNNFAFLRNNSDTQLYDTKFKVSASTTYAKNSNLKESRNNSEGQNKKHSIGILDNNEIGYLGFEKHETIQNSDFITHANVVINKNFLNSNFDKASNLGNKVILNNCKGKGVKVAYQKEKNFKPYQVLSESGTESENETVKFEIGENFAKSPKKFLPVKASDQLKSEPKLHNKNARSHKVKTVMSNQIKKKNDQIYNSNIFLENSNSLSKIESDVRSNVKKYSTDMIKPKYQSEFQYTVPDIKIQKACVNIQGKETKNYKADILSKRDEDKNITKLPDKLSPTEDVKTTITHNFIKKQIERNSVFKSPENPPKNRLEDISMQEIFLINEIEEQKNPNEVFIKSEENFDVTLQDITSANDQNTNCTSFSLESPDRSGYSPKLIQDLDSNKIFKQKSFGYSPKLVHNIDSNQILKPNFYSPVKIHDSISLNSIANMNCESNIILSPKKEVADAVDFLCNFDNNFIRNEEDNNSETSSSIDDSEILKPEDFLQNISQSFDQLKEQTIKTSDTLFENNFYNNNSYNLNHSYSTRADNAPRQAPIVIENKILAESEKINFDFCLRNVQLGEIVTASCSGKFPEDNEHKENQKDMTQNSRSNDPYVVTDSDLVQNEIESNKLLKLDEMKLSKLNEIELNECSKRKQNDLTIDSRIISFGENHKSFSETDGDQKVFSVIKYPDNNQDPIALNSDPLFFKNNNSPEKLVLPGDDIPFFEEEEVVNTTEIEVNPISLNLNANKPTKPKTIPLSSKRPRLRGSKINLVQRRKGLVTTNSNKNLLKEPDYEENPAISPHLSIENGGNEKKDAETSIKNFEEYYETSEIVKNHENEYKEFHETNQSLKLESNVNDNNCNENSVEYNSLTEHLGEINPAHSEINCHENPNINSSAKGIDNFLEDSILLGIADESKFMQSNHQGTESNGSDLSNTEFIGFDLSSIKLEDYSVSEIYNTTINEITNKLNKSEDEKDCSTKKDCISDTKVKIKNEKADAVTNYTITELPSKISENEYQIKNVNDLRDNIGIAEENVSKEANELHTAKLNFNVSFRDRKISVNSQNSFRKHNKTLTSDSDSFGEDDCVPLKKRAIRVNNIFSNSSTSESEQPRKENRIRILDKRDYFSSRKDSENSATSDYHPSITDFSNMHFEADKLLESNIPFDTSECCIKKNSKPSKETKKSQKKIKVDFVKQRFEDSNHTIHSDHTGEPYAKSESSKEFQSISTEKTEDNSKNSKTNSIAPEENIVKLSAKTSLNSNSAPIAKKDIQKRQNFEVLSSKKRKNMSLEKSSTSDDDSTDKKKQINKQINADSLPNQKAIENSDDTITLKKKRGRRPKQADDDVALDPLMGSKKLGPFEKFCKQLYPIINEKRKNRKPTNSNSSLLRKMHPNLLLVDNRCDIDNFEIKGVNTQITEQNKIVCGLCKETVLKNTSEWANHLHSHYGVGWIDGQESIDITQYNVVLNWMINFMKITNCKAFRCRMCQAEFKSALGVLSHILSCGLEKEEKRGETHILCQNCNKHFHYLTLNVHMKSCTTSEDTSKADLISANAKNSEHSEVLSNTGRFKRKSTVKAENKLKEIEKDCEIFDVNNFIKTIYAIRGGIYRAWKKKIFNGLYVKCCGENCEETFNDFDVLKTHVNDCSKILRTTYHCKICKFFDINIEKVKIHINNNHQKILENYNEGNYDSEIEFSNKDLSESSDQCSSGVDENETSLESENIDKSDEEHLDEKKKRRPCKNTTKQIKSYPSSNASRSLLPSERNMFAQILSKTKEWTNFFFNNNFTSMILFPSFVPHSIPVDNAKRKDYQPVNQVSMKFSFSKNLMNEYFGSSKYTELQELDCFKWIINKDELLMYIGGPITAIQWVPLPDSVSEKSQYLAISYKSNYNKSTRVINQKSHKTSILIFKLETLKNNFSEFFNDDTSHHCKFQYGIICDNGPIHDMKFLPSGGYDLEINRLALLAVASADNDVNIYSLPIEAPLNLCDKLNNSFELLLLAPVMKLTLNIGIRNNDEILQKKDHYFVQCCKIAWSKAKGHNILATGYVNGGVALWDIDPENNLNCFQSDQIKETLHFSPVSYIKVSDKFITSLDFHYDHKEARWLAAGSCSRTFKIFDIENFSNPTIILDDVAKSLITSSNWPIIWENIISGSSSDLCLAPPVTISPMQLFFLRRRCAYIPSGITCIDYDPWNNVFIVGTENGDFTLEIRTEYNLDCTLKRYVHTKIFTYTDLIKMDGSDHLSVEKLAKPNKQNTKKVKIDINSSKNSTSIDGNIEAIKFFDKDYKNKYSLVFGPLNFSKSQNKTYMSEKRNPMINLNYYVRINSVACNMNSHGSNFYTIGYENGFIRIFYKKLPKL